MSGKFNGRVAFVTGAGTGIGAATATLLGEQGASVAVVGLPGDPIAAVAQNIESQGGRAIAVEADVSSSEQVEAAVAKTVEAFGALHLAFNNAGVSSAPVPTGEIDPEDWRKVISVNLDGVFFGMRYQIPRMLEHGLGSIVNTASVFAHRGLPTRAAYTATKHALIGLTRATAIEYATSGIRVNAVCPGVIDTPMLGTDADQTAQFAQMIPMKRLGEARELANAVSFLLSTEASYITGQQLTVDGGYLS